MARTALLLMVALAVTASAGCAHAPQPAATVRRAGPSAEAVMGAFEAAWNRQALDEVRVLFAAERRGLLDAEASRVAQELATWRVDGWRLDPLCHPRGDDFLLVRLQRRMRRPLLEGAAPREEIVWLRHDGQAWWLYSL